MASSLRLAAALALAWLIVGGSATASPFVEDGPPIRQQAAGRTLTLDDVLSMQTFGSAALSPDGVWAVYERRRPYDTAPRFDRSHRSGWAVSELMIARTAGGPPEPLLPPEPDAGFLLGAWSPDSRRLLVYRLCGDRLEAGVVEIAGGAVVWTGLTPDLVNGVSSAWLDGDRLVLTTRPGGDLPWSLRFDGTGQAEMDRRWERTAAGREPSRSRIETRDRRVATDAVLPTLQLMLLDLKTGDRRVLAEGAIRDFAVSPGGDRIAVLTSAERAPRDASERVVQSAVQTRSRLTLIDVDGGAVLAAPMGLDIAPHLLRWSPTGDAVLIWARRDEQPWSEARLRAVSARGAVRTFDSGDLDPLEAGGAVDELRVVQADWLGGEAVLRARRPGRERRDWWRVGSGEPRALTAHLDAPPARLSAAGDDRLFAFADGRLWALGGEDGAQALTESGEALTDGQTYTLMTATRVRANEAPRQAWIAARSLAGTGILEDGGFSGVASRRDCAGSLQGRSVVRTAILTVCLDQGVETLSVATLGAERVLDRVNVGLAEVRIPQARAIAHRDPFGRDALSYLFLPPDRRPEQVKGLVVMVYPGVADDGRYVEATRLGVLGPSAQVLASEGYAVLSVSLPDDHPGGRATMIDDFVSGADLAVDAALAAVPGLPEDRMALLGHSFGGYAALTIATRQTRFRSVVAWAAPTDPAGKWGEFGPHFRTWPEYAANLEAAIGTVEVGQAMMGGPPWTDIEGYAAASPFMLADRITAPILLITADRDYVTMTQSERLLSAMHRQGKWARLVTYWGETHSNASPANVRDVYREIFDWLDRTLEGAGSGGA